MKKILFLKIQPLFIAGILAFSFLMTSPLLAASLSISKYYPVISGEYSQLRFMPRTADLNGSCATGSLYMNSSNKLQYCNLSSTWSSISDIWTQNGDNIYLSDSGTNPNLHVGIGTTTPNYKLTIINDPGIIAAGTFGSGAILPAMLNSLGNSRLIWYPRKAAFRAGYVDGLQWEDSNIGNYSAAMGRNSTASGHYSVVGGGDGNTASGLYSAVIGGQNNTSAGDYSSIIGGLGNGTNAPYSNIIGGNGNTISGNLTADYSTILGGTANIVGSNSIQVLYATIGGGSANNISTPYSNINGGQNNIISQFTGPATGFSVISGGSNNKTLDIYAVVSGGDSNTATAAYTSVGGGKSNFGGCSKWGALVGPYSRTSGGQGNITGGQFSTVSGGFQNQAWGDYSMTGGGNSNFIAGNGSYSIIAGGELSQTSQGTYSMTMGGSSNRADGDYSWAEGKNIQIDANADRTFAWGYSDFPVTISTPDAFIIAPGTSNPKVGIRMTHPTAVLEIGSNSTTDDYINISQSADGDIFTVKTDGYLGINRAIPTVGLDLALQVGSSGIFGNGAYLTKGGVWTNSSSRVNKANIQPLTSETAQTTLDKLDPVTFNYKTSRQTNAGFIAEDVPDIVAMNDRRSLSAMDIIAVLTKVSQDQEKQIKEQQEKISKIKAQIKSLKEMLGEQ